MKRQNVAADRWRITLRAQNKAPRTIDAYLEAGRGFHLFLQRMGMPTEAS